MIRKQSTRCGTPNARRATVVVAAVALFACLMTGTAQADHQTKNGGAHWGRYRWNNTVVATDRSFWLFDRTGNPLMHQAIQQWVQSWNAQRNLNVKGAPSVMYYQDDANVGQCKNFAWPGYSFTTICAGDPGTTGITSLQWVGAHIVTPYVLIRPANLNFGQMFTAVTHEMGHVFGLSHRPEVGQVMHANSNFDGAIHWYDQHDLDAINALYSGHTD